jgi:pentatricopeptide repeat protein
MSCRLQVARRIWSVSYIGRACKPRTAFPPILLPPDLNLDLRYRRYGSSQSYINEGEGGTGLGIEAEAEKKVTNHRHKELDLIQIRSWWAKYLLSRVANGSYKGDLAAAQKELDRYKKQAAKFIGDGDVSRMRKAWADPDDRQWFSFFRQSVLIGSLSRSANEGLTVLELFELSPASFRIRADCLFALRADVERWAEIENDAELSHRYWSQMNDLRKVEYWPRNKFQDKHHDMLLQNVKDEDCVRLLKAFIDKYNYKPWTDKTLLYFVDCYTRLKDVDTALSFLRRISPTELQRKSGHAARRATNLLKLESMQHDGESHAFKILPAILEMDIPPDDIIYNLVTQKSILLELPAVGWDIFRYARKEGVTLNSFTHLLLLKDSFMRRDTEALSEILSIIQQSTELYQAPPIVACMINIIRCICYYERGSGAGESMTRMLGVWDKVFSRGTLGRVGMLDAEQVEQGNKDLPNPDPLSLAFMVFSFVMVQRNDLVVDQFWLKLTTLLSQGDRELLDAAGLPVFYDGFIAYYARKKDTIPGAVGILRSMISSETCTPGRITWNIMLGMFLRHDKPESAETVRQLMQQRGVEYAEDDWQNMLHAYPHSSTTRRLKRLVTVEAEDGLKKDTFEMRAVSSTGIEEELVSSIEVTSQQSDRGHSLPVESAGSVWTTTNSLTIFDEVTRRGTIREEDQPASIA